MSRARAARSDEETFRALAAAAGSSASPRAVARRRAPRLTEPWFCCAEPMEGQLAALRSDDAPGV